MSSNDQRVVVTGASGFIGGHVCRVLRQDGWHVAALVRPGSGPTPDGVRACPVDGPHDLAGLMQALDGAQGLVHLAARVHVMGQDMPDAENAYSRANVDLTAAVLEGARAAGVARFVFVSSVKAVGAARPTAYTEADAPAPVDAYGRSKLDAERLVRSTDNPAGLRTVILRFPLVYGPGMKGNMLRLFEWIDRGRPVPAATNNVRSLLYAGNAAEAVHRALYAEGARGGTFFVTDGHALSTAELVEAIASALHRPARVLPLPHSLLRLAGRIGDTLKGIIPTPLSSAALERLFGSLAVDDSLFRECAGFRPSYSLEEGLQVTADWYRSMERQAPRSQVGSV